MQQLLKACGDARNPFLLPIVRLPVNVGIDVGKSQLDVVLLERNRAAITALIRRLSRYRFERIVIEATGRLEQPFVRAALGKGLPVVVVSPLKIRRFAGAIGQLAKTDTIDARLIARFAAALKPVAYPANDPESQIIKGLVVRRSQLTSLRTMEKTAARSCQTTSSPASTESSRLSMPNWRASSNSSSELSINRSTCRLAPQTRCAYLNARYRSFGRQHTTRRSARTRLSQPMRNRRPDWGRALQPRQREVPRQTQNPRQPRHSRTALYLSAMVAIRFNADIKRFYERLLKSGKHKKVALTACIRKIVTTLNAMLRDNTPWQSANA